MALRQELGEGRPMGRASATNRGRRAGSLSRVAARTAASALAAGAVIGAACGTAIAQPVVQDRAGTVVSVSNWCTGEDLTFVGSWHYVIKENPDGTHTAIYQIHATAEGQYTLNEERRSVFASGGGFELKGADHGVIVSRGDAPNVNAWFYFDFTVQPPVFSFEPVCRG